MARRPDTRRRTSWPRRIRRLVALGVSSVWTFVATTILGGAIVMVVAWKAFGLYPVAVVSGSMEPTLPVSSLIWVKEVPAERVAAGDIITFDAPGERIGRVTHRVVGVSTRDGDRYFETKGDGNRHVDDWRKYMPAPEQGGDGTVAKWAPGVSYGDQPAVRYVWGVPYLGHAVELSQRPRLRLGVLLGLLGAIGVTLLAQIWSSPGRRGVDVADEAAAVRLQAPTPPAARLDLRLRADELIVRASGSEPGVVEVHRIALPEVDWSVGAPTAVVRSYDVVDASLAGRFDDAPLLATDAARLRLGPLAGVLGGVVDADRTLSTDGVGQAVRAALDALMATPQERWLQERVAQLVLLHATLRHFARETATVEPEAARDARGSRVLSQLATTSAAAMALLAFSMASTTEATLVDALRMAAVRTTGDQINPIADMDFTSASGASSTNLRSSWSAPAAGITPTSYDFWRSTSPGVDTSAARTANTASSPWDATLAQCSVYYYRSKSRYMSMISAESAEFSWLHDGTAPVVSSSIAVTVPGTPLDPVAGWGRLGSHGNTYLYATVTDNCAPASSAITVTMDTTAIAAGGSTAAPATFGSYTPISGGSTYNFRVGPVSVDHGSLTHGSTAPWSITATVSPTYHSHTTTASGAAIDVDGANPTVQRTPVLVADRTNYYAPEVGSGAVTAGLGFRLVGGFADSGSGWGTQSIVADTSAISTTASVSFTSTGAPFSTENGIDDWTHRTPTGASAPLARSLADGTQPITVTVRDRVGNSATSSITGRIDSTRPTLAGCSNLDPGGQDDILGVDDVTRLQFSEAMEPGSIVSGWNDGSAARSGLEFQVWNAQFLGLGVLVGDFIAYTGTNLQASSGSGDTYGLGSSAWSAQLLAGGHDDFANSSVSRAAGHGGQRWDLVYAGGSAAFLRPGGLNAPADETFRLRTSGTGAWDVAGNNVSTASLPCPTIGW